MGVLIVAALASLASSPGQPTVTRDFAGHAAFIGESSTLIDVHVAVAPVAAENVGSVNIRLQSIQFRQPSSFALEARLLRAPGPTGPAEWAGSHGVLSGSDWQPVPTYWSWRAASCAPNVECALDFQIEFRPRAMILREVLVPWQVSVSVASVSAYDYVSVTSASSSTPLAPSILGLLAAGIGAMVAALAFLVLRRWLPEPGRALRLSEIGVALPAGIVGAIAVLTMGPGTGADVTGILMVGTAPVVLFVALRRPPGTTPRATVAVIGMLLLPTSSLAFQSAAAVEGWAVMTVSIPIGAIVAVGAIGLAAPRAWWASALRIPPYRHVTVAAVALISSLLALAMAATLTATVPDPTPLGLAVFAVWVLLAYREWTESPSRALRVAGIALAVLGVFGLVAIDRIAASSLFGGNPPRPVSVPAVIATLVVVALAFLVAKRSGRRLEPWSLHDRPRRRS